MRGFVHRYVPDYSFEREAAFILPRVEAYAESLVAAGDMDSFEGVFGVRDPDVKLSTLDADDLREIYREYVCDEDVV